MVQVSAKLEGISQPWQDQALQERVAFFVQHLTQPAVAEMLPEQVAHLFEVELARAERALRLQVFDQLALRVRGPREGVPHYPQLVAFLCATARERLSSAARDLAAAPDARARNLVLLPLHSLRRAPMPRTTIDRVDALLALYAAPHAPQPTPRGAGSPSVTVARPMPREPVCRSLALRTLANYDVALTPVRKHKATRAHLRAATEAKSAIRISSFEVKGQPNYSGWLSSTFQLGGYCKLRVLLTAQDQLFAVRQAPTEPQGRVRARRAFADGTVDNNHPLVLLDPTRYLQERWAQRLAASSLYPQLTLFDQKQRLWDVVPLFDGDLFTLSESFAGATLPRGLLVRTARAVLRVSVALDEVGWQHNDVKPDNLLWQRNGEVELGDLGLAGPIAALGHTGTCGYLDPDALLNPHRRGGRADLYALAMTLVHLVDPYYFHAFPLAFHADGTAPSDASYSGRLRLAARAAVDTYDAWRPLHDAAHASGGASFVTARADVEAVELAWRRLQDAAGAKLADLALLFWAEPRPAQRGSPREALEALDAAHPDDDDACAEVARQLASAGAADAGARRIDATLAALTDFRDAWLRPRSPGPSRTPSPSAQAVGPA